MKYKLINSTIHDIDRLIKYKKKTIYEYAPKLSIEEVNKIENYVSKKVPELLEYYSNIVVDNNIVGCLLIYSKDDGMLLDEIYIEENYRNKGIGTDIIKNILEKNNIIYLYVYKDNIRAFNLYKRLGFNIIEETESRYYMKYMR